MKEIDDMKAVRNTITILGIIGLIMCTLNIFVFDSDTIRYFALGMALTLVTLSIEMFIVNSYNIKVLMNEIRNNFKK